MNRVYKWIEQVQILSGANREIVYDLSRATFHYVTLGFAEIKEKIDGKPVGYESNFSELEQEWVRFMKENELLMEIPENHFENFTELSLSWETPFKVSGAVIEFSEFLPSHIKLLDKLVCRSIEIIVDNELQMKEIINEYLCETNFRSVNFRVRELSKVDLSALDEMFTSSSVICDIIVESPIIEDQTILNGTIHLYNPQETIGKYYMPRFVVNQSTFFESIEHNVFFNQKLFFKTNGDIQVNPNLTIGDSESTYEEILKNISSEKTQLFWNTSKSKIDICNLCEHRNLCVDNRIPQERANGCLFYEGECAYNPLISLWYDDENFKSLYECGVVCDSEKLEIDIDRIAQINKSIWD